MIWQLIVIAMVGYLLGSINLSIILSKLMGKGDIREHGSGNAGTTNTLRVLGVGPAIIVFLFDLLKGVLAILLGRFIFYLGMGSITTQNLELVYELAKLVAAFSAVFGHNYPIYYGFKGGKGIATSLGTIFMLEWQIGLICLIFGVVLIIATRMVSFGSVTSALLYPVLVIVIGEAFTYQIPYIVFAILIAILAIYRHRANIERIFNATERKLWYTKAEKLSMEGANGKQEKSNEGGK